ncbi:hypothetical protein F5X98DRAFT_381128 [Xylaria grammica]|nr:hypothetical protein F5X98DRAFT_381128 [Xylaria grammica]
MCIYHYHGFTCGHADPEAASIPPTLCQQRQRLPHEPMCNPPIYNIKLNGPAFCKTCQEMLASLREGWAGKKREWRESLPEVVIRSLEAGRTDRLNKLLAEGMKEGPSHVRHTEFATADYEAKMEGEKLYDGALFN